MIIRRRRNRHFTVIGNHIPDDERLSFEAVGVLSYLLSRPDNWQVHTNQLKRRGGFGRDKARRIIGELIDAGYVVREQLRSEDGRRIDGVVYTVFDEPQQGESDAADPGTGAAGQGPEKPALDDQGPDSQGPDSQGPEKPGLVIKTDSEQRTDSQQSARARESGGPETERLRNRVASERRFWNMARSHPKSAGMPKRKWLDSWLALSPDDQDIAERRYPIWLATLKANGKDHVPALSTYFGERLFAEIADPAPKPTVENRELVTVFGPDWFRLRWNALAAADTGPWERVERMDEFAARVKRGVVNALTTEIAAARLAFPQLVAVALGGEEYAAWQDYSRECGYPQIPAHAGADRIFVPVRNPPAGRLWRDGKGDGNEQGQARHDGAGTPSDDPGTG